MKYTTESGKNSVNETKTLLAAEKMTTNDEPFRHYKKVADYLLGKRIGEGSFAKVKLALHVPTKQKVAIKIINKRKLRKDSYTNKHLHREGRLLQMSRHPNIVQVLDILESSNNYYLVTEYCSGGSLIDLASKKVGLPESLVWKYVRQLVDAVAHLHELKIVHRDLKVENLLLDSQNNIKIIDFGLSNIISSSSTDLSSSLQTQCGSPAYAAPELLAKQSYGPKVDVWSIGVITFSLLVGKFPFTSDPFSIPTLCRKMVRGEMNSFQASVSPLARSFVRTLLNPNHKYRPYIDEVQEHKWLSLTNFPSKTNSVKTSYSAPEFRYSGEKLFSRHRNSIFFYTHIDLAIVQEMKVSFDFEEADVIQSLRRNKPGAHLSTYHLLLKKKSFLLESKKNAEKEISTFEKVVKDFEETSKILESQLPANTEKIINISASQSKQSSFVVKENSKTQSSLSQCSSGDAKDETIEVVKTNSNTDSSKNNSNVLFIKRQIPTQSDAQNNSDSRVKKTSSAVITSNLSRLQMNEQNHESSIINDKIEKCSTLQNSSEVVEATIMKSKQRKEEKNGVPKLSLRKSLPSRLEKFSHPKNVIDRKRVTLVVTTPLRNNKKDSGFKIADGNVSEKIKAYEKRKTLNNSSFLPAISRQQWSSRPSIETTNSRKNSYWLSGRKIDNAVEPAGKLLSQKWQKLYGNKQNKPMLLSMKS